MRAGYTTSMKILITGSPGSGKTTLLADFLVHVQYKQGFVAREIRHGGERTGFELISSDGNRAILASIDIDSPVRVSRYGVDVPAFDGFLESLPTLREGSLAYIDEIGQMELYSERFKEFVRQYLDQADIYVGTITSVYRDDFIDEILGRDDIILLNVRPDNRDSLSDILVCFAKNLPAIAKLSQAERTKLTDMARVYARDEAYTQLRKLFKNAVVYVAEKRVRRDDDTWRVRGNYREHIVVDASESMSCDCDLYNGRNQFEGRAGECSHIQAVRLILGK